LLECSADWDGDVWFQRLTETCPQNGNGLWPSRAATQHSRKNAETQCGNRVLDNGDWQVAGKAGSYSSNLYTFEPRDLGRMPPHGFYILSSGRRSWGLNSSSCGAICMSSSCCWQHPRSNAEILRPSSCTHSLGMHRRCPEAHSSLLLKPRMEQAMSGYIYQVAKEVRG
jgi:hypothetical protein